MHLPPVHLFGMVIGSRLLSIPVPDSGQATGLDQCKHAGSLLAAPHAAVAKITHPGSETGICLLGQRLLSTFSR